ncbi:MAG: 30S ribosomal protein S6 [Alphaproteobacteria bacterium]|nr:30S ribosomal protein S6 [Alphaproteobacteria bacterium]
MPLYEHVFIARQDAATTQVEQLTDQMKAIIENGGGKVTKVEQWGLRSLTYKINKNRKGHYVLFNIDSPWAPVAEMERQLKLNEDVIRLMTIKVEELEEGPSAGMLAKQARERRDAKWGRGDEEGFEGRPERSFEGRPERGDRPDRGDRPERGPALDRAPGVES